MIEYISLVIMIPIIIMAWVAAAVVCRLAWKDFFRD